MGCHPIPLDELHHFSRWWLNRQPDSFMEHVDSALFYIMDDNDIILHDIDSANSAHFYIIDHIYLM